MPKRKPIPKDDRPGLAQIRRAAMVMAATMILWMLAQVIGAEYGWPVRLAFLFDLAAIGALVWALVVTYWVWKQRRARGR